MPEDKKAKFLKVSVKPEVKREIAIISASEGRFEYELVDDMLKLYQAHQAEKAESLKLKKSPVAERRDPEPVAA